jgi:hypothetical protein
MRIKILRNNLAFTFPVLRSATGRCDHGAPLTLALMAMISISSPAFAQQGPTMEITSTNSVLYYLPPSEPVRVFRHTIRNTSVPSPTNSLFTFARLEELKRCGQEEIDLCLRSGLLMGSAIAWFADLLLRKASDRGVVRPALRRGLLGKEIGTQEEPAGFRLEFGRD